MDCVRKYHPQVRRKRRYPPLEEEEVFCAEAREEMEGAIQEVRPDRLPVAADVGGRAGLRLFSCEILT